MTKTVKSTPVRTQKSAQRSIRKRLIIENPRDLPVRLMDVAASPPAVSSSFQVRGSVTPPPIQDR